MMKKKMFAKQLLLTFCAVGALAAANQSWADYNIDNCAQVSTTTEGDTDSTPANKADTAAILAAFNAGTNEDDESCAPLLVQSVYDLGDAPDSYGTTGTNGAKHEIIPGLKLGALVDDEADGQPGPEADGDGNDEDGVNIPSMTDGQAVNISVTATNTTTSPAQVMCWIDYNGDDVFATDGSESAGATVPVGADGTTPITIAMPQVPSSASKATGGTSYARCRLTTDTLDATKATGTVVDGEVEDYKVTFTAAPQFDLALRKTLAAGQATSVQVGDTVTYTLEVFNQGGIDATAIEIVDYIPAGMELADSNWTENVGGTTATYNTPIATLAAGGTTSITITLRVRADAVAGSKRNAAEIVTAKDGSGNTVTDIDSTPDNNPVGDQLIDDAITDPADEDDHDVADVTVVPTVDIALEKTVSSPTARRGETITYTLTVTNNGPDAASNVAVTDRLPANLTYVSDNSGGNYDSATGVWTVGDLLVGDTNKKTITITATVK